MTSLHNVQIRSARDFPNKVFDVSTDRTSMHNLRMQTSQTSGIPVFRPHLLAPHVFVVAGNFLFLLPPTCCALLLLPSTSFAFRLPTISAFASIVRTVAWLVVVVPPRCCICCCFTSRGVVSASFLTSGCFSFAVTRISNAACDLSDTLPPISRFLPPWLFK